MSIVKPIELGFLRGPEVVGPRKKRGLNTLKFVSTMLSIRCIDKIQRID